MQSFLRQNYVDKKWKQTLHFTSTKRKLYSIVNYDFKVLFFSTPFSFGSLNFRNKSTLIYYLHVHMQISE